MCKICFVLGGMTSTPETFWERPPLLFLGVIFISRHCEPTQYLLSLHKLDKIAKLKQELCALIGQQMNDIIIAEVLDWHVSRILVCIYVGFIT